MFYWHNSFPRLTWEVADRGGGWASLPPCSVGGGGDPGSLLVFLPSHCKFICLNFPSPEITRPRSQCYVEKSFKWGCSRLGD